MNNPIDCELLVCSDGEKALGERQFGTCACEVESSFGVGGWCP